MRKPTADSMLVWVIIGASVFTAGVILACIAAAIVCNVTSLCGAMY